MPYTLPPEWATQSAVLLTWPHSNTDWAPILQDIEAVYLKLAQHISARQLLVVACHSIDLKEHIADLFNHNDVKLSNVRFFIAPCNDTWARDHGPISLLSDSGNPKVLDFTFNAWGAKYSANLDNEINGHLFQQPFFKAKQTQQSDLILEGGSIESDGLGTLMTTSICLLNENRNANLSKQEIEHQLLTTLGMNNVLWIDHGHLAGDDTDAHVDTLARFAPEGIVYVQCKDKSESHYAELHEMEKQLKHFVNMNGDKYPLFPLPMPSPISNEDGELLPATYANYLIINGAVLVPTYNDNNDQAALNVIQKAHPNHDIIGVDCNAVIQQFGSLHCLTMQMPAGVIV
ncbi:agmatine deiminase family protein [Psychrosphaera sp.]|nr:agmatine deiminase family protein [Psychrosphaera sp.]